MKSYSLFQLILISVLLLGCTNKGSIEMDLLLLKTDDYEGVILTNSKLSDWTPSIEMITQFEEGIGEYLVDLINSGGMDQAGMTYNTEELVHIANYITTYKRQYIGINRPSKSTMYCNFLSISNEDWKENYIQVNDGGAAFFSINYDVEGNRYFDLKINGSS
ncbi:hypothetical protein ACX93W_21875 [Paenibacillus sp. CAU 1782]